MRFSSYLAVFVVSMLGLAAPPPTGTLPASAASEDAPPPMPETIRVCACLEQELMRLANEIWEQNRPSDYPAQSDPFRAKSRQGDAAPGFAMELGPQSAPLVAAYKERIAEFNRSCRGKGMEGVAEAEGPEAPRCKAE